MTLLILVETNGTLKSLKAKELTADTLYKKCGFRTTDDFSCQHTWKVKLPQNPEQHNISVWAKTNGKANFENKYDFPPPIDKTLFFGTCAIVQTNAEGNFIDLTMELWLKIYEHLFGGFEDLGEEDEYSEDELANVDPSLLTSNGYLKDGFVISDSDTISPPLTPLNVKKGKKTIEKKSKPKAKPAKKTTTKKESSSEDDEESESDDTTSELEEDVYTFSDDE